jgi:hypothetical protein
MVVNPGESNRVILLYDVYYYPPFAAVITAVRPMGAGQ